MWDGILVIVSFVAGMFVMYKFSENYNKRIREAWVALANRQCHQRPKPKQEPKQEPDEYDAE